MGSILPFVVVLNTQKVDKMGIDLNDYVKHFHFAVQGMVWVTMQTASKTAVANAQMNNFVFLAAFWLFAFTFLVNWVFSDVNGKQWGFVASGLSFVASLLFTLNAKIVDGEHTVQLVGLWLSSALFWFTVLRSNL